MNENRIPKRILNSLLTSLSAGVVPRNGAPYIAIGRTDEISAMLSDLQAIDAGSSSVRFLIGKYGSGKSFLIQLIRGYAMERGFLCADCDLSPERRLYGSSGSGLATCRELIKNLSCKSAPDGGALPQVISRWLDGIKSELAASGLSPSSDNFASQLSARVYEVTRSLQGGVGGFDFASALNAFYHAETTGDELLKSDALRWLRCEYNTKTEAKKALPVGTIITDENWYDYIKLLALFSRAAGYKGLVVFIDECVNLYKIPNRISRENNYEKLLAIFNDSMQGRTPHIGFIFGGTPQFLEDNRRGLFSYDALKSRLQDASLSSPKYKNMLGPVIRLRRLSDDELYALIARLTSLHAMNYNWTPRITEEETVAFLKLCLSRMGAESMITPREVIREYLAVLNILYQNESVSFSEVADGLPSHLLPSGEADMEDTISLDHIDI